MESSIIENTNKTEIPSDQTKTVASSTYKLLLCVIIICVVLFIFFHATSCYHYNKNITFKESYINGSPRDDPQDDNSFDVGKEVKKLIQLQEQFLEKLERARKGN